MPAREMNMLPSFCARPAIRSRRMRSRLRIAARARHQERVHVHNRRLGGNRLVVTPQHAECVHEPAGPDRKAGIDGQRSGEYRLDGFGGRAQRQVDAGEAVEGIRLTGRKSSKLILWIRGRFRQLASLGQRKCVHVPRLKGERREHGGHPVRARALPVSVQGGAAAQPRSFTP